MLLGRPRQSQGLQSIIWGDNMISLKQLIPALISLGVSEQHIQLAIAELQDLLTELDEVQVKGRQSVDTLLGCMMAIDALIGKDGNDG